MNRADAPAKQAVPFGVNGQREALLPTTPAGDNTASYDAGFPPVTMILKAAGGLPPKGQDMNQILYELSALARWFSAGAINSYDATFATAIGGYPKGAVVIGTDGITRYLSITDSNATNPDSGGAGWFNLTSGYLQASNNLSEISANGTAAQEVARANIGLGNSATLNTGAVAGTVATGNDSRIIGAAQKASNLSDLANAATARSNLGLGTAATLNTGNGAGQIPTMANFTSGPGWVKFPDGTIIQFGVSISGPVKYPTAITLPVPFTQEGFKITTSFDSATSSANGCPAFATTAIGLSGFYLMSSRDGSTTGAGANWIAIGR